MHLSGRTRRRIQRAFNALESGFLADATVAELAGHLSPGDARRELAELDAAHPDAGIGARLGQLDAALAEHARRDAYVADHGALGVQRFHAAGTRLSAGDALVVVSRKESLSILKEQLIGSTPGLDT